MMWQDAIFTLLDQLVQQHRLGLVTDVDGTISPIVPDPEAAAVTPRNRELLQALQSVLTLTAVISGRAVVDVQQRVGIPGLVYVGNHGLERWEDGRLHLLPEVNQYRPALSAALTAVETQQAPGMWVEDKGATLSIHFRQTDNPDQVEKTYTPIIRQIARSHNLHFFQGRRVFELRPPLNANKGSALAQLVKEHKLGGVLYIGDDTTDGDALTKARDLRRREICYALGVGVLSDDTPPVVSREADLLVDGVSDVEALFAWLLKARKASFT